MRIEDWRIEESGGQVEVSAAIDGFRLWFRAPRGIAVSRAADPFVAAALLPAMLSGEPFEIVPPLTVSPRLLEGLTELQEIHHRWNPVFQVVPVRANAAEGRPVNEGSIVFFSGGVDSTCTFLKRRDELTHLVFIQGFDFYVNAGAAGPFTVRDIADLSLLAFRLTAPRTPLASALVDALTPALWTALATALREALHPGRGSAPRAPRPVENSRADLEDGLAAGIEAVLSGPPLWQPGRFAGVRLRPETRGLIEQAPQGADLYRLNRMLLEDALPLEIARRDETVYRTAIDRNTRFARANGKTLLPVSTNHYAFGYRYNLSRNLTQGGALASVALLLGFPKAFVPGSYAYDQLIPLGSHPLTDPLYSSGSVRIVHDGAESRRVDKIARIARDPAGLDNLRVCFDDMNSNCGRCAKCLRTMIPLRLLGAPAGPFPPLPPPERVRKMIVLNDVEEIFFRENLEAAEGAADRALVRTLAKSLKRYERQKLFRDFDRVVLGGRVKRAYLRRSVPAGIDRIHTTPGR